MTGRYAEGTAVAVDRSQAEIGKILGRYGVEGSIFGEVEGNALVMFRAHDRNIRLTVPMPRATDPDIAMTLRKQRRTPEGIQSALVAERKRRWRCLALAVKSKMETVATGIETFEEAWAMHTVMPDGRTVGEHVLPAMRRAITEGKMPTRMLAIEG